MWCNEHRLKQIISNLVRNAAEHGCRPDRPRITISSSIVDQTAQEEVSDARTVSIRVHDNGPGIDPKSHKEIFLPGRRLPQSASDGSGMGLAIVKRIVQHYKGTVEVDPDCPTGVAMVVSLPAGGHGRPRPHCEFPSTTDTSGQSLGHDIPHGHKRPRPHQASSRERGFHGRR